MLTEFEVIYWDASAILSVIFKDTHSTIASAHAESEAVHFISSLAYSEVAAVISRMKRESILSDLLVDISFDVLERGPWRRIAIHPDQHIARNLAVKWPLKGADLWHLAAAKSLKNEFPELVLLTFDSKLTQAAKGESLLKKK